MNYRYRIAENLVAESKAYGYTLSIWGAGALLVNAFGVPGLHGVFAYLGGALVGFGLLAGVAFGKFFERVEQAEWPSALVVSMVHIFATLGNLLVAHGIIALVSGRLPPLVGFFLVGAQVTVLYNLFLLLEDTFAERLA